MQPACDPSANSNGGKKPAKAAAAAAPAPLAEFVFLNFNGQNDAHDKATRRAVRSRAAAHSHRTAPRKGLKAAKYRPPDEIRQEVDGSGDEKGPVRRKTSSSSGSGSADAVSSSTQGYASSSVTKKGRSLAASPDLRPVKRIAIADMLSPVNSGPAPPDAEDEIEEILCQQPVSQWTSPEDVRHQWPSSLARNTPPPVIPSLTFLSASKRDPFLTYPVEYEGWFGWLLDFWYDFILPRAKHMIKMTQQDLESYVVWSKRLELTEPALFYMSLFLATGIPVSQGRLPLPMAIWLRGQTVKALNEALMDPTRAVSTAVISAVGKAALHEHIYGSKMISHQVHRPAQQRMIAIRGGIEHCGFPDTTLQLMVWYDALMSAETGTPAYFAEVPRIMGLKSYSREEAITVTNVSSPQRYQHPGYGQRNSPKMEGRAYADESGPVKQGPERKR